MRRHFNFRTTGTIASTVYNKSVQQNDFMILRVLTKRLSIAVNHETIHCVLSNN